MKMYIFIKDSVPDNMAPVIAAHASLSCYLTYKEDNDMIEWKNTSFKKVVCKITEEEFNKLKFNWETVKYAKYNITTESSLKGEQVAITFCPRKKFPETFKTFKLWEPKTSN